jgi:hypothetical protein
MPKSEGLADPQPFPQHREQEPVPQPGARVQDRLDLCGGQDPRQRARRLQLDRPPPFHLAAGQVMQERLPARAPGPDRPKLGDQIAEIHAVAGVERIQPADRRQLPVDRGQAAVVPGQRQQRDPAVTPGRRQTQPGDELAQILQPDLVPVQGPHIEEIEPVLQVVGVGLDRVRRPLDIGEIGQVALDRLYRPASVAQDRPGLKRRDGHQHPLHKHRTSGVSA